MTDVKRVEESSEHLFRVNNCIKYIICSLLIREFDREINTVNSITTFIPSGHQQEVDRHEQIAMYSTS